MYSWLRSSRCWPTRWVLQGKGQRHTARGKMPTQLCTTPHCVCARAHTYVCVSTDLRRVSCTFKATAATHMAPSGKYICLYTRHALSAVPFIKVNYSYLPDCGEGKGKKKKRLQVSRKKNIIEQATQERRREAVRRAKYTPKFEKMVMPQKERSRGSCRSHLFVSKRLKESWKSEQRCKKEEEKKHIGKVKWEKITHWQIKSASSFWPLCPPSSAQESIRSSSRSLVFRVSGAF